jgi:hypothetical protein
MSKGWSDSDKQAAQKLAAKAKSTAEREAIRLHRDTKIEKIEDLWAMELKIREWRRERQHSFAVNYETIEAEVAEWLVRDWLESSDLEAFSNGRRERIKFLTK